mgnify:FL=1
MNIEKRHSTKPERVIADLLTRKRIPFKFREIIEGREVDFVIGRVIVEVDGVHHDNPHNRARDKSKNEILARLGYVPLHFSAREIRLNAQRTFKEIMKLVDAN